MTCHEITSLPSCWRLHGHVTGICLLMPRMQSRALTRGARVPKARSDKVIIIRVSTEPAPASQLSSLQYIPVS